MIHQIYISFNTGHHTGTSGKLTYRALMGFLPCVPPHVHDQHVLSFERFLVTRTLFPATHERLLVCMDVVIVDML